MPNGGGRSTDANKAVIRRLFADVFNGGDTDVVDELVAAQALGHDATSREPRRGMAGVKQVAVLFRTAFPDGRFPLEDLIAEGDKVVARWGLQRIHRGAFMGVGSTARPVSVTGIVIYRLVAGKIVEYQGTFDTLGLMQQLGALPTGRADRPGLPENGR